MGKNARKNAAEMGIIYGERFSFVHTSSDKIGAKMHKRHTMKHKAALELLFEKNPGTLN